MNDLKDLIRWSAELLPTVAPWQEFVWSLRETQAGEQNQLRECALQNISACSKDKAVREFATILYDLSMASRGAGKPSFYLEDAKERLQKLVASL